MDPLRCPFGKQKAKDWIWGYQTRKIEKKGSKDPAEQRKPNGKGRGAAKPHTLNCIFNCFGGQRLSPGGFWVRGKWKVELGCVTTGSDNLLVKSTATISIAVAQK